MTLLHAELAGGAATLVISSAPPAKRLITTVVTNSAVRVCLHGDRGPRPQRTKADIWNGNTSSSMTTAAFDKWHHSEGSGLGRGAAFEGNGPAGLTWTDTGSRSTTNPSHIHPSIKVTAAAERSHYICWEFLQIFTTLNLSVKSDMRSASRSVPRIWRGFNPKLLTPPRAGPTP